MYNVFVSTGCEFHQMNVTHFTNYYFLSKDSVLVDGVNNNHYVFTINNSACIFFLYNIDPLSHIFVFHLLSSIYTIHSINFTFQTRWNLSKACVFDLIARSSNSICFIIILFSKSKLCYLLYWPSMKFRCHSHWYNKMLIHDLFVT